ncbi:MAG: hypothetical protein ACT4RN_23255 [Pseudonocardia sp.]
MTTWPDRHADRARRRAAETWLRRRGLPLAVRHDRSAFERCVPALVFLTVWGAAAGIAAVLSGPTSAVVALVLVGSVPFAVVPAWRVSRALHRAGARARRITTWSVWSLYAVVTLPSSVALGDRWSIAVLDAVAAAAALLALVCLGVVSILGWALRIALRRLGGFADLAGRALPLLMLFTLFGFFTAEIWQAIDALAPQGVERDQLWGVVAFFVGLTCLLLISLLRDETQAMIDRFRTVDPATYRPALRATPLDGLDPGIGERRPLSRPEKANLGVVLFLGHALQALVFSAVVFVFFLAFGLIAVEPVVIESWVGHPPTTGRLFGFGIAPVSDELVKVSLFLAAFSGMYFAANMARDEAYRTRFFEPLVAEVAATLAGRDVYLAVWENREPTSQTPPPPEPPPEPLEPAARPRAQDEPALVEPRPAP